MASQFTQAVDEIIAYEQTVIDDLITSVTWSSEPSGVNVVSQSFTTTVATSLLKFALAGNYVVTCLLALNSGQVRKGQARFNVVEDLV